LCTAVNSAPAQFSRIMTSNSVVAFAPLHRHRSVRARITTMESSGLLPLVDRQRREALLELKSTTTRTTSSERATGSSTSLTTGYGLSTPHRGEDTGFDVGTSAGLQKILASDAEDDSDVTNGGVAKRGTIPKLTISLVKSIVGSGILALPAGIAALGDSPDVIPVALVVILLIGAINAYFFSLIGQVCEWTNATSYRDAWDRTVGAETSNQAAHHQDEDINKLLHSDAIQRTPASSQVVAVVVALKTALACLAYSMILADSFHALGIAAGLVDMSRTQALLSITVGALLPLCLLKDLTALTPFSLLGIIGMAFTSVTIGIRHHDGSYALETGAYIDDLPQALLPSFGDSGPHIQGVVLACTLATAFVAHYNAPRFRNELVDSTRKRFNTVIFGSYAIAALTFMVVATEGFLTFGASSTGLILNNYSPFDPLITASRAAVAVSILFAFPLPFVGFRDGMMDVLQLPDADRANPTLRVLLSIGLLSAVTLAAANLHDLAFVLSVGGGSLSTAVASVFPTLMYRSAVRQRNNGDVNASIDSRIALALMYFCVTIGITGVGLSVAKALHL
jgi:amino acid permease